MHRRNTRGNDIQVASRSLIIRSKLFQNSVKSKNPLPYYPIKSPFPVKRTEREKEKKKRENDRNQLSKPRTSSRKYRGANLSCGCIASRFYRGRTESRGKRKRKEKTAYRGKRKRRPAGDGSARNTWCYHGTSSHVRWRGAQRALSR